MYIQPRLVQPLSGAHITSVVMMLLSPVRAYQRDEHAVARRSLVAGPFKGSGQGAPATCIPFVLQYAFPPNLYCLIIIFLLEPGSLTT